MATSNASRLARPRSPSAETKILLDRTPGSKALYERAVKSLPTGVASNFQAGDPYPVYLERGSGSNVWDVDGTEYTDFHGGFGVNVVGHAHPKIVEAIRKVADQRHPLRRHDRDDGRARRGDLRAVPAGADAVRQLRDRGDDGRAPGGPRRDRPRQDHQDGGLVPRAPRLGAVLGRARGRRARTALRRGRAGQGVVHDRAHVEGHPRGAVGHGDRRAVQRRRGGRAGVRATTRARSPR